MIERQLTKKRATRDWKTLLGRELPANVDAEKAALAAVLLNDENFAQVAETLLTTDFYSPGMRTNLYTWQNYYDVDDGYIDFTEMRYTGIGSATHDNYHRTAWAMTYV